LLTGFATHAFAQDETDDDNAKNTQADTHHNTEEPKEAEEPAPVHQPTAETKTPPPGPVVSAQPTALPTAKPKVGDLSISGYLRGGFGAVIQQTIPAVGMPMDANYMAPQTVGGRMTCFSLSNPAGLVAKYRLGNECEVWSETHFTIVTYAGEDGVVSTVHFMPTIFIPTTNVGNSPNATVVSPAIFTTSTGATFMVPNLYIDLKGIDWLGGGTAWAGTRYYKRESVYINDFFYWNPSGVGAGVEDINLGKDPRLSVAVFAVDGEPQMSTVSTDPLLPSQLDWGARFDVQLRGIKPIDSAELQFGLQYIWDYSNHPLLDAYGAPTGTSVTHGGYGFTFQYVQKALGGDNKFALQFGKGGGTGFGTLSRFYYPDFSLYFDPSEYRFRLVDVFTMQPFDWLGGQFCVIYQRDQNFLGVAGQNTNWYSAGGRLSWAFAEHAKLLAELGYDEITKSNGAEPQHLTKFTVAPALTAGKGFLSRPELRAFITWAVWNEAARGANIDSGQIYRATRFLDGYTFGLQAETWY
jgi:maltoporin